MNVVEEENWLAEFERDTGENDRELAHHSWEAPLRRTWDDIEEDESGLLRQSHHVEQREERQRRGGPQRSSGPPHSPVEKGMLRYVFLIVDMSDATNATDLRPTRKLVAIRGLANFVKDFFDQNPLSVLGIIAAHNKKSEMLTDISGNPLHQIRLLEEEADRPTGGEFSLQNSLELARASLRQTPDYGSREVLLVMSSISTCDPGDVFDTIESMRKDSIRCSVISLTAELYVCKSLTQISQGTLRLAMNEKHLGELLALHVPPSPIVQSVTKKRQWVHMGFPQKRSDNFPSLCQCHGTFSYEGYFCPRCMSKLCELPSTCQVCSLTLVSAPHLARSYRHLFPIEAFEDVTAQYAKQSRVQCYSCLGCIDPLQSLVLQCQSCSNLMCWDCDLFIHQALHNCPGCFSTS